MNLRKAAEAVKALGPTKAWSDANELANYYLYQPDMLAEAVELLRQAEQLEHAYLSDMSPDEFDGMLHDVSCQIRTILRRYDAAQQERNNEH